MRTSHMILHRYLAKFQPAFTTNNNILCLFYISEISLNCKQADNGNETAWSMHTANWCIAFFHICGIRPETVRIRREVDIGKSEHSVFVCNLIGEDG